ncbi:hypothetical protein WJX72_002802 [[Myrmecia] bisecta]|uniref:Cation/H+ exchanger transmembrane domain-containing protein n=1 Tax=[Myrmecia] bisecta TaxID=41462 RepID=A0AAW1QEJ7_9CHLO
MSPRVWAVLLLSAVLCTAAISQAAAAHPKVDDEADASIAGPIVHAAAAVAEALQAGNGTDADPKAKKTIAQMIDEALEQEFPEEKQEAIGKNYNETAKNVDAKFETVVKVSQNKPKETDEEKAAKDAAAAAAEGSQDQPKSANGAEGSAADGKPKPRERHRIESQVEKDVDRIIDAQDNEYVLSAPKDGALGLTLDPQLIRDLTVLITSSTLAGMALEAVKQPVINGYFIAGSIVGPGGFKLIKELVQVESLAQVGVQLLLFTLGLEFSMAKLRAVRSVALIGGMVEIFLFILVAGCMAHFIGASVHEGIFVGALVSMSSTSIVVKCLSDTKLSNSAHGQITIGTLILQDCMVGLLFAFMPVLANNSPGEQPDHMDVAMLLFRVSVSLGSCVAMAVLITRTLLPPSVRFLAKHASSELYQLTIIAFCLVSGLISGYMGLSTELGAFVAGVMLSATDQQENALHHLENIKHFFLSLFVSSTGLVMSPKFLMQHLPVLAGGVLLCIISKTVLISGVVFLFGYPARTALAVGLSMAQIGEFAFVLLSVASQLGLMPYQVYMLLMGVTALSLLITPFLLQATNRYLLLADADGAGGLLRLRTRRERVTGPNEVPELPTTPVDAEAGTRADMRDRCSSGILFYEPPASDDSGLASLAPGGQSSSARNATQAAQPAAA